jgi:hypothetical protein
MTKLRNHSKSSHVASEAWNRWFKSDRSDQEFDSKLRIDRSLIAFSRRVGKYFSFHFVENGSLWFGFPDMIIIPNYLLLT